MLNERPLHTRTLSSASKRTQSFSTSFSPCLSLDRTRPETLSRDAGVLCEFEKVLDDRLKAKSVQRRLRQEIRENVGEEVVDRIERPGGSGSQSEIEMLLCRSSVAHFCASSLTKFVAIDFNRRSSSAIKMMILEICPFTYKTYLTLLR